MSRGWPIAAWLLCLTICAAVLIPPRMAVDLGAFLPDATDPEQSLVAGQLHHGATGRLLLVTLRRADGDPARPAEVERLVQQLEHSGAFRLVAHRPEPGHLPGREQLDTYRYLLSDGWRPEDLTAEGLRDHFEALAEEVQRGGAYGDSWRLARDPTGEQRHLLGQWLGDSREPQTTDGWRSADGHAVIVAWTAASSEDLDAQQAAIEHIRKTAGAATPPLRAAITGAPAIAVESRETIRAEVLRISTLAGLAALTVLVLALQSLRAVLLAALPVLTGIATGAASVHLAFGGVHGITLAFGATLLGVTLDYPLHHLWHSRDRDGKTAASAVRRRLLVGALSTALGFTALALAGVVGLQQLALFSVTGLLAAAATTSWVLPALQHAPIPPARHLRRWRRSLGRLPRVPRTATVVLAWLLVSAGVASALTLARFETDLAGASPVPQDLAERDGTLRSAIGLAEPRYLVVVHAASREETLQASEKAADELDEQVARGRLERFDAPTQILPSAATQSRRAEALPDPEALRRSVTEATAELGLRAEGFAPFIEAVSDSSELPPLQPHDLQPGPIRDWVQARLHQHPDGSWSALLYLGGVQDPAGLERDLSTGRLIDLRRQASALATDYQHQAMIHFGLGAGLIVMVLLLGLRSAARGLEVALSAAAAVGGTIALLSLLGIPLGVFHIIAMLLVVGLSIDYGLFARPGDPSGMGSVTVCAVSSVVAFTILATAKIPLLQAMGLTVACGATLAWLLAILFANRPSTTEQPSVSSWPSNT